LHSATHQTYHSQELRRQASWRPEAIGFFHFRDRVDFEVDIVLEQGTNAVGGADLYTREIGQGPPVIVLHGGPDFDHTYLLPEMDRLTDLFHLFYYDQRGRGRSAEGVKPGDVTLESEIRTTTSSPPGAPRRSPERFRRPAWSP